MKLSFCISVVNNKSYIVFYNGIASFRVATDRLGNGQGKIFLRVRENRNFKFF